MRGIDVFIKIAAAIAGAWLIGAILLLRFWASSQLAKSGSGRAVRSRIPRVVMRCVFWPIWFAVIAGMFVGRLALLACVGKAGREALRRNGK
jgi:hypothetical protein